MDSGQTYLRAEKAPPIIRRPRAGGRGTEESTTFPYEIFLVDDHTQIRQGVRSIIAENSELEVVGELSDGLELLDCLKKSRPQMIILDISMPRLGGIQATRLIKSSHPEIKVLILTMHNCRKYVDQARLAGAEGYVLKDELDTELLSAIEALRQGKTYLSPLLKD
jgi:two-component system, NarL family, response regulator NreC